MKKKIAITSELPGKRFAELLSDVRFDVKLLDNVERKELKSTLQNINPDGLITLLSDKIEGSLIELLPNLKVISNYAAGFNNIDIAYCREKGIVVTNTPDVLTDSTADIAILLLLMASRRAGESEKFARASLFTGWEPKLFLGKSLAGKTLGILGMGRIGIATARRAKVFGLNIVYWSRRKIAPEIENELEAKYLDFDELLKTSDFISIHLPYVSELYHLIGKNEIAKLKNDAIIINTARGQLIDESALANALEKGEIYAAGFDVYEFEPKITEKLLKLDNVVLLPHIGSATEETRMEMTRIAIDDCLTVLLGGEPCHKV